MKFATLALAALISNVSAVELHNQAHAKGLKAPHQVRSLAQDHSKENFGMSDVQGMFGNAEVSSKNKENFGMSDVQGMFGNA